MPWLQHGGAADEDLHQLFECLPAERAGQNALTPAQAASATTDGVTMAAITTGMVASRGVWPISLSSSASSMVCIAQPLMMRS